MFNNKATTYQQMEKPKKEKKFKQNEYEEIRKLVEENEGNDIVKEVAKPREDTKSRVLHDFFRSVKNKQKQKPENIYKFKIFD